MLDVDSAKKVTEVLDEVAGEYIKAREMHKPMNSGHEGYAVLLEEVEELWDDIKSDAPTENMRKEAIQVGAMALAFIIEVCGKGE